MKILRGFCLFVAACLLAAPQTTTDFYVDPSYTGAIRNGTVANPWQSLADTVTNNPWTVIDSALTPGNVNLYFSACKTTTTRVQVKRANMSANRLTFDGATWQNTGGCKFQVSASLPFFSENDIAPFPERPNITIRGFRTISTGGQIAVLDGMSGFVFEHNELSSTSGAIGPGLHVGHSAYTSTVWAHDVIIRDNIIHDTQGECIYVSGSTPDPPGAGSVDTGGNWLITRNTIYRCGSQGGQGDGIDIKDGHPNVTISYNNINLSGSPNSENHCIVAESAALIENNFCSAPPYSSSIGVKLATAWNNSFGRSGVIARNNIIAAPVSRYSAFQINAGTTPEFNYSDIAILSNTLFQQTESGINSGSAMVIAGFRGTLTSQNNIFYSHNGEYVVTGATPTTHSNNIYRYVRDSSPYTGTKFNSNGVIYDNDNYLTFEPTAKNADPLLVSTLAPYMPESFRLLVGSPAIGTGVTLASFSNDYSGATRTVPWDLGAYKSGASTAPAPTPTPTPTPTPDPTQPPTPVPPEPTPAPVPVDLPPVPGGGGTISVSPLNTSSLQLRWTAATDDKPGLLYEVRRALVPMATVSEAEAKGAPLNAYTANLTEFRATGLKVGNDYYFVVIAKDIAGQKAIYRTSADYGWFAKP